MKRNYTLFALIAVIAIALSGCGGGGTGGGGGGGTDTVSISISPSTPTLDTWETQIFTATVSNTSNLGVTWSVQGGASKGTITSSGVYTSPSSAGTYHIVATSQADPSKQATATVTVTDDDDMPPPPPPLT